jgi:D-3-phosphoglycerate dehydrogenase / 2-oxoglutarate reductase
MRPHRFSVNLKFEIRSPPAHLARMEPNTILIGVPDFERHCPGALDPLRKADCTIVPNDLGRWFTEDELTARIAEAGALIAGLEPITARVIAAAPRLQVISRQGVGYDNVDLEAAKERGIPVTLTPGAVTDSVAEMAFALLLALARRLPESNALVRAGEWRTVVGVELNEKTLGVIGTGQIGKALCRCASGFRMKLLPYDTRPDDSFARAAGIEYVSIERLLAESDFVSLHLPVLPDTRHFMDGEKLARMKKSACLINTARGALVDEPALYEALSRGTISAAASDVFEQEPPGDNPVLRLDNFIASPHSASSTDEAISRMSRMSVENVVRVLRGEEPLARAV